MEYFQDKNFDWQQLMEEEGSSIYDLLKDENFEVDIFNENVYAANMVVMSKSKLKKMSERSP